MVRRLTDLLGMSKLRVLISYPHQYKIPPGYLSMLASTRCFYLGLLSEAMYNEFEPSTY